MTSTDQKNFFTGSKFIKFPIFLNRPLKQLYKIHEESEINHNSPS
jgi:hypothetical protein